MNDLNIAMFIVFGVYPMIAVIVLIPVLIYKIRSLKK